MRRHPLVPLLVLLVVAILVAGCGGSGGGSERKTKPPKGPRAITAIPPSDALTKDMGDQGAALTAAGCSFGAFDQESAEHVDTAADLHFDSFPPTSGTHYPDWAPYGLYTERIEDGYAVHDMEHGGVVVWFGTKVDTKTQDAVAGLLDEEEKWVVAPRPDIPGLYAAAWAKGLSCPPAALDKLGAKATAKALDTWYDVVNSTGSDAEKDLPAYAGSMKEPTPERDISADPPTF